MALLLVDEPEGIYYGGTVCAPIVREYFENILPYLGIEPNYTEEELSGDDVGTFTVPGLLGKSYSEAKTLASEMGFELDVLGEGEIVHGAVPGRRRRDQQGCQGCDLSGVMGVWRDGLFRADGGD